MNFRKYTVLVVALSLPVLGSPALAWSPLQYDTEHEVGLPEHSVMHDILTRVKGKKKQQEEEAPTVTTPPAMRSNHEPEEATDAQALPEDRTTESAKQKSTTEDASLEEAAQSAIEKDASSTAAAPADKDADTEEAKPMKAATEITRHKTPGKVPNEDIQDPEFFNSKAQAYVQDGDYQSALNYVNKALVLNPNYWDAWYQKGLIFQLSGHDGAAARRYISLLERKPDMLQARIALGSLYRKHGNKSLAEKEYRKAIEINFYCFPAHYNIANLFMDEERYDMALKEYKVCLKLQPTNAQVHNNIGVIYQHRNYLEEAADEFKSASHLDPASKIFADNLQHVKDQLSRKNPKQVAM